MVQARAAVRGGSNSGSGIVLSLPGVSGTGFGIIAMGLATAPGSAAGSMMQQGGAQHAGAAPACVLCVWLGSGAPAWWQGKPKAVV